MHYTGNRRVVNSCCHIGSIGIVACSAAVGAGLAVGICAAGRSKNITAKNGGCADSQKNFFDVHDFRFPFFLIAILYIW